MNVLLIYPKFPDTFWSFNYALKFIRKKAANPPLGLLTVAALLPDKFQRRLVDVNVNVLTDDDLSWADLAFIGAMAIQRDSANQIIARCKTAGLKVIAGGPLFTAEPDAFEEVDHLVLDEAELTLPRSFKKDIQGIGFLRPSSHPAPLLGSDRYEKICVHEHSVFQGVSIQLRLL
jgi:radical SAM superfamily enzyme YgiQ (UPF0313 family)